jgi:very-short-patch-repair endonuclease
MSNWETILRYARDLRRRSTPCERLLWGYVRNRQFYGYKFLRQHTIIYSRFPHKWKFFIADFYCHSPRLVVELDGPIHDFQKEYDENRDLILTQLNMRVLRIRNEEVEDIEKVLRKIGSFLTHPTAPSLHSREGESEVVGEGDNPFEFRRNSE